MPYTYQTTRRPGRHIITLAEVRSANRQVTREMDRLGLWSRRLDDVTVWHVPASLLCYGWFRPDGDIYIPAVTGAQLSDLVRGHHTRLVDVLRHEWAHALADRHPAMVSGGHFRDAFGGRYGSCHPASEYDPDTHFTPYASTQPCEDFAETFHFFLRHKGRLPVRLQDKPALVRKWRFIAHIATRLGQRRR